MKYFLPDFEVQPRNASESDLDDQWGITELCIHKLWSDTTGKGINVCILDTGVSEHYELKGSIVEFRDFTRCHTELPVRQYDDNSKYHGTAVAGIIGARKNNRGMMGVAPDSNLYIGKIIDSSNHIEEEWLIKSLMWVLSRPEIHIVNMSFMVDGYSRCVHVLIKQIVDNGKIIICGSGNESVTRGSVEFPAAYPETISIGAVLKDPISKKLQIWPLSSVGDYLDFVAPGVNILSLYGKRNLKKSYSGTSFASAIVTGVVALILSKNPKLLMAHNDWCGSRRMLYVKKLLMETAKGLSADHIKYVPSCTYGFGLINPHRLIKNKDCNSITT